MDKIIIKGARENNLKNVDLEIPKNTLTVFTGLSGSGKSSLAFDTIFAEGQRRYMESLSSYARMFLGQMKKPDVDSIDGLSPAISIDQKTTASNPRSTVGTVTEIYDYLRLLWARVGVPHCPNCGKPIQRQTVDQITDKLCSYPTGTKLQILAPVIRGRKGEHEKILEDARRSGFTRVRIDGSVYDLSEAVKLEKNKKHNIEIIVDRIAIKDGIRSRISDAVETSAAQSGGLILAVSGTGEETLFSQNYACEDCGISIDEIVPRSFSFNNPSGACPECSGLGIKLKIDENLILRDKSLSILDGAISASGWSNPRKENISAMYYEALSEKYGFSLSAPVSSLPPEALHALLYGTDGENLTLHYARRNGQGVISQPFEGVIPNLERRYEESASSSVKADIEQYMSEYKCPACNGRRLRKASLAVTVGTKNISEFTDLSVKDASAYVRALKLSPHELLIAGQILKEIGTRLDFLNNVGLSYLTLSRSSATLSGGESQRIRLATQIGSGLTGVLYVLDEPSIGLHQRDNDKLIKALKGLRDLGNTLIVVEHDEDTIRSADYIVDIGPGAGEYGGKLVACGKLEDIMSAKDSETGAYLSGRKKIEVPTSRRLPARGFLSIRNACENNLKHLNAEIPVGLFTCITGVSGSGKSSLINEVFYKTLSARLNHSKVVPGKCDGVDGLDKVDKIISIDQSPIGRTPRSNPATYTSLFSDIRDLFASLPEAKLRGFGPDRFSFNVKGGRCEACCGDGMLKVEMHFLPDVFVPCEVCGGSRYNRETLEIRFKDKNISDVLNMTVDEAVVFFENQPKLRERLLTMQQVGLGYVRLGQSSTTLSGGEAQRVKLAAELSRRSTGRTVYVMDEPTTGLHSADVRKLIDIFQRLTDSGNTVVVIEHNLEVIKCADYIIDLGPDGGDGGGNLVFAGTPEECAHCQGSATGHYLDKIL